MIFIGFNYEGYPISIVNAKSEELANAFWQGREIYPHSIKCLESDYEDINKHITGVFPLFEAKEKEIYVDGKHKKFLVVKK